MSLIDSKELITLLEELQKQLDALYYDDHSVYGLCASALTLRDVKNCVEKCRKYQTEQEIVPVERRKCENCKHSEKIPDYFSLADLKNLHCKKWNGQLVGNLWSEKKRGFFSYSLVHPDGNCNEWEKSDGKD